MRDLTIGYIAIINTGIRITFGQKEIISILLWCINNFTSDCKGSQSFLENTFFNLVTITPFWRSQRYLVNGVRP